MNWTQFALLQILIAHDTTRIYVECDSYGDTATAHLNGSIKLYHSELKEMTEQGWIELKRDGQIVVRTAGLEVLHQGCNRFGTAMRLLERAIATEMPAPDEKWFQEYFALTGEHMVLTEEGWIPGKDKAAHRPEEILDEVNAPAAENESLSRT
jgi:hypothetical protein